MHLEKIYKDSTDMKEFIYLLFNLAREVKGDILEIGVRKAQSTRAFLKGLEGSKRLLYSVDIKPTNQKIISPNWVFLVRDSRIFPKELREKKFSIVMIDGDHSYKGALNDWEKYGPLCEVGGYVIFHDVTWPKLQGGKENGAKRLWEELDCGVTLDLNQWGLGILKIRGEEFK